MFLNTEGRSIEEIICYVEKVSIPQRIPCVDGFTTSNPCDQLSPCRTFFGYHFKKFQNKGSINSTMEFGFIVASDGNILFVHDVLHVYLGFFFHIESIHL